jgi:hypothetical protein
VHSSLHFGLEGLLQKRSHALAQDLGQRVRKKFIVGSWKTLVSVWAYHFFSQLSRIAASWSAGSEALDLAAKLGRAEACGSGVDIVHL